MDRQIPNYINSPGLRQDILSFKQNDPRRKRFFICLKMLAILPNHPQNQNLQFNINVKTKNTNFQQIDPDSMIYSKPKRIHDELIASHVTCCEHQTPFFSYYHRNILIYMQLQLNYADQYLRTQDFDKQKQFKQQWMNLMIQYRMLIKQMKQKNIFDEKLMCHYWNPTNYTALQGKFTTFPIQLIQKQNLENIDILFEKVNSHLPWNINLRTRFYQLSPQQYRKINVTQDLSDFFFSEEYLRLSQDQKLIIQGISNPRSSDPEMVKHFFNNYIRKISNQNSRPLTAIISNEVAIRNKIYFQTEGNHEVVPLYNMKINQFYLNYGIGIHNQHWFNSSQIKDINNKTKNPKMIPEYYNTLLPHYQFAYAYAKSQKSFIGSYLGGISTASANTDFQKKIQHSHNTMHNNACYIMSDPNFSLTNLIFFPYHSWIDYELQIKIRQLSDLNSYNIARQQLSYNRQRTIYDILTNQKGPYTIGSYRLVDWVNPRVGAWRWNSSQSHQAAKYFFQSHKIDANKSFRYTFKNTTFKKFVLNESQKHIRRSDELHQIYKNEYEIQKQTNKNYSYFKNLKSYNFNYHYEIYEKGKRIIMDKSDIPVLPSYLSKIIDTLNFRSAKVKITSPSINSQQNIQLQGGNQLNFVQQFTPLKIKEMILTNPILALGKYSSLIKSNTYHIQINFLIKQFQPFNQYLSQTQLHYIKQGFYIKAISIFSKGKASSTCPKCAPTKKFWIDVADRLRQLFPVIWKVLILYLIQKNRIIYTSLYNQSQNQQNQVKTSQIIQLKAETDKFKKFNILEGAEQIQFDILLLNENINQEVSVKLDIEVYSIYNQKIQSVASKTLYSLEVQYSIKHFDFYKMLDLASSQGDNNFEQFDKYYYKKVKGQIRIGEIIKRFSYQIPNYHRLIRYLVKIQLVDKQILKNKSIVKNQKIMNNTQQINSNNQLSRQQFSQDKQMKQIKQQSITKNHKDNNKQIFVQILDKDYDIKRQYYENWTDNL